ncbi:Na(+)-translocating NADH-quinone reductase subunit C [Bacteroidia bacterium]|nr:Na(+)-translocating NADH-quinone reductase subunit C [Bacteroidia bacterium]
MNKQGNTYTVIYAVVLVVLVAAVLSVFAMWLQPRQRENIEDEKRQNILSSVKIEVKRDASKQAFGKYIVEQFVVNAKGERVEGTAFTVDLAAQGAKACEDKLLPVFVADIKGSRKYILPVYGYGLWGPIWGYISLNEDKSTIYGTVFDHSGETPGLGAEITLPEFRGQFADKTVFEQDKLVSIHIKKGKNSSGVHEVDAISGGTLTSKGVEEMLKAYLGCYEAFLKK